MNRFRWLLVALLVCVMVGVGSAETMIIFAENTTDVYWSASQTDFSTIRNGSGTHYYAATTGFARITGGTNENNFTRMDRFGAVFNTSPLSGKTISSVVYSVYIMDANWGPGQPKLSITQFLPLDYSNINNIGNFQRVINTSLGEWTYTGANKYANVTLNDNSVINTTGYTGLSARTNWDVNNNYDADWASGGDTYMLLHQNGNIYPPLITVTYTSTTPVANFTANVTSGATPHVVGFVDTSSNTPTNWDWYWYDNETKSSDLQNPSATLTTGSYNVRLWVSNDDGGNWKNKTGSIIVVPHWYYAYGDSITQGAGNGEYLNGSGNDAYIIQMRDNFDPTSYADHNMDGSAQNSSWGLANIGTHYNTSQKIFFVMFGTNDGYGNIPLLTANLVSMYDYAVANGSTAYILLPPIENGSAGQEAAWGEVAANLSSQSKNYATIWDAMDTIPYNCIWDSYNATNYIPGDSIHPNRTGHLRMAEYIWDYLDGGITCPVAPHAAFTANTTSGTSPLTVSFQDDSTNNPTNWDWYMDVDETKTSDEQNPIVTFTTDGTYNIRLYASNAAGGSWYNTTTITITSPTTSISDKMEQKMTDTQNILAIGVYIIFGGIIVTLVTQFLIAKSK